MSSFGTHKLNYAEMRRFSPVLKDILRTVESNDPGSPNESVAYNILGFALEEHGYAWRCPYCSDYTPNVFNVHDLDNPECPECGYDEDGSCGTCAGEGTLVCPVCRTFEDGIGCRSCGGNCESRCDHCNGRGKHKNA